MSRCPGSTTENMLQPFLLHTLIIPLPFLKNNCFLFFFNSLLLIARSLTQGQGDAERLEAHAVKGESRGEDSTPHTETRAEEGGGGLKEEKTP